MLRNRSRNNIVYSACVNKRNPFVGAYIFRPKLTRSHQRFITPVRELHFDSDCSHKHPIITKAATNGFRSRKIFILSASSFFRRGAGAVEQAGLENRSGGNSTVGSNHTLSAFLSRRVKHLRRICRERPTMRPIKFVRWHRMIFSTRPTRAEPPEYSANTDPPGRPGQAAVTFVVPLLAAGALRR